ncbi:hypothetical protein [Halorubellus litoreus]|uniref:Uncharacterized protein n=1 Tax=Halorubellus litoreus TaxID=755308 RepID=A0ABD5VE08_9EURY
MIEYSFHIHNPSRIISDTEQTQIAIALSNILLENHDVSCDDIGIELNLVEEQ